MEVKPEEAVKALIWGWQQMVKYPRLLRWAWVSRGLVSKEEMEAMHPGCDVDDDPPEEGPFKQMVPGVPDLVPLLGPTFGCFVGLLFRMSSIWRVFYPPLQSLQYFVPSFGTTLGSRGQAFLRS